MSIEVACERPGRAGDGIADGSVCVPCALPGKRVRVRCDGDRDAVTERFSDASGRGSVGASPPKPAISRFSR